MFDKALSERESKILNLIVESYVQTASPVGSRYLCKKYGLNLSPATVRNVMNDLEEMGFITQPHVSSGRVPTDRGYRFYVDGLTSLKSLARRERRMIVENLRKVSIDVTKILDVSSQVLANISTQLGVVLEPSFRDGVFQRMELVAVSENKLLAVISIKSGLVKTFMMELDSGFSVEQLHDVSWVITERLSGLSLQEVKETIDVRLRNVGDVNENLIRLIIDSSHHLFDFEREKELHLGGAHYIMSNPEFSNREYAARILELIESKEGLLHLLDDRAGPEHVSISIGSENREEMFRDCSVVVTRYHVGNIAGTLGVVGPTRMQYAKIIPLVEYMGKTLTQMLCG